MCGGACFCLLQGRGRWGFREGGSFSFIRSCRHSRDKAQRQRAYTHQRTEGPPSTTPLAFVVSPLPPSLSLVIIRACSALDSRQGKLSTRTETLKGLTVFADMVDLNNEAPVFSVVGCV